MKKILLPIVSLFLLFANSYAQEERAEQKASFVKKATSMTHVASFASKIEDGSIILASNEYKEGKQKRRGINQSVPGKGLPIGNDPLMNASNSGLKHPSKSPIVSWIAASSNSNPSDPTGAVGPEHYINAWNSGYRIWDKEGNALTPALSLANLWPGETDGDPIVLYDRYADRFIITQAIFFGGSGFLVAICEGTDPVNDDWYTYQFDLDEGIDYPKYSIWSDGYYITTNKSNPTSTDVVFVLERDSIIAGNEDAQMIGFSLPGIETNGFYSPLGFNCNGTELPPAGDVPIIYMQDDDWASVDTSDHLKIWNIDVDWETPDNSTISDPYEVFTEAFMSEFDGGSFSNLPQPTGTDIDALQATIMNMAQYRRFESYNAAVLNFVVALDETEDYAGIRWYELRQNTDGEDWTIHQEGTYVQPDGHSAFSGSMAMDADGNIGMAYSVVSETQSVSIRYTGRYSFDPLNEMTLEEDTIQAGADDYTFFRYGDYAHMTLDPSDDRTFWHIAEFYEDSERKNVVGAFKLSVYDIDAGISALNSPNSGVLSDAEVITVSIQNYGLDTLIDVPVGYIIDGGSPVNEMYSDTILPQTSVDYSFSELADFSDLGTTYEIKTYTAYIGDEQMGNDTLLSYVKYLYANDLGVNAIGEPNSGTGLSENELVKVNIYNYGSDEQSDFEVSYSINAGAPVTEMISETVQSLESLEYTFSTTADLSNIESYAINAYTMLTGDQDHLNDTTYKIVENEFCQPESNCGWGDGFTLVQVSTIDNATECSDDGYGDYTDLIAELPQGSDEDLTINCGYSDQFVNVWIDFNDNFVFEDDELLLDNFSIPNYEATTSLPIANDALLGQHLMRFKSNWDNPVPEDACESSSFAETEDYTAEITFVDGIDQAFFEPNDLIVKYHTNNQFEINFSAVNTNDVLDISIHNTSGQMVFFNRVVGNQGNYVYSIDMSYAAKGVYLLRLGSQKFGKIKKIVVK